MGFCGDGVNDVAALQAADVGLAVGASPAAAAASVSSPAGSVTGALCAFRVLLILIHLHVLDHPWLHLPGLLPLIVSLLL